MHVYDSTATVTNCTIRTTGASALLPAAFSGGAVAIDQPVSTSITATLGGAPQFIATVTLVGTVVEDVAATVGGAVFARHAKVVATDSTFQRSAAAEFGGCIFAQVSCCLTGLAAAVCVGGCVGVSWQRGAGSWAAGPPRLLKLAA